MTQKSSLILELILMDILLIGYPYKNIRNIEKGESPKETAKKIRQKLRMAKTKTTAKKRFFESLGSAY